jgi:hypothetical protein
MLPFDEHLRRRSFDEIQLFPCPNIVWMAPVERDGVLETRYNSHPILSCAFGRQT